MFIFELVKFVLINPQLTNYTLILFISINIVTYSPCDNDVKHTLCISFIINYVNSVENSSEKSNKINVPLELHISRY